MNRTLELDAILRQTVAELHRGILLAAATGDLAVPKRELAKVLLHEMLRDEMVDHPIHEDPEPAKPGDCDRCGTTYAECTRRILRGACCPACRTTEHHPGMHTWEAWSRRNHA